MNQNRVAAGVLFAIRRLQRLANVHLLGTGLHAAILVILAACASLPRTPFTEKEQAIAEIPGMPGVRFWADAPAADLEHAIGREGLRNAALRMGAFNYLTLSGGGYDGAFGAGVLNGWTATRTRPQFTIVSGVSAGALIAPFAFLGPEYDGALKDAFTNGMAEGIGADDILSVLSMQDSRRETLHQLIASFVDERFLKKIAEEHRKGRRLFVVTTNLDAQRSVVWNMGAIAASGNPRALELFRDVLTASASIPAAIRPTRIEVQAGNRRFEELHADGGVTAQLFTVPESFLIGGLPTGERKVPGRLFIILNNWLMPEFEVVEAGTAPLVGRSLSTIIKSHARLTLIATLEFARTHNFEFNLTYIAKDFKTPFKPGYNRDYMNAVFAYGYHKALSSRLWENTVPLGAARASGFSQLGR